MKRTEDDEVLSHVTITKASMHSKYPGTASHVSRMSKSVLDHKFRNLKQDDLANKFKPSLIKEVNEGNSMIFITNKLNLDLEKLTTKSKDRLFSNQKLKRITSPLVKPRMNLKDSSIKSPSEYLFSPHKRAKPLIEV